MNVKTKTVRAKAPICSQYLFTWREIKYIRKGLICVLVADMMKSIETLTVKENRWCDKSKTTWECRRYQIKGKRPMGIMIMAKVITYPIINGRYISESVCSRGGDILYYEFEAK